MEICLRYPKYSYSSRTTKCNSHRRKGQNKVTKLGIFPPFKQLTILCKLACTIMTKESETKAKVRNKIAIRKRFTTDSRRLHFLCLGKVILLSTPWTRFKTTLVLQMEPLRITTTLLFQHMEITTQGNMPQQVTSFKAPFKMGRDWQTIWIKMDKASIANELKTVLFKDQDLLDLELEYSLLRTYQLILLGLDQMGNIWLQLLLKAIIRKVKSKSRTNKCSQLMLQQITKVIWVTNWFKLYNLQYTHH